jgi:hypothetical protein
MERAKIQKVVYDICTRGRKKDKKKVAVQGEMKKLKMKNREWSGAR